MIPVASHSTPFSSSLPKQPSPLTRGSPPVCLGYVTEMTRAQPQVRNHPMHSPLAQGTTNNIFSKRNQGDCAEWQMEKDGWKARRRIEYEPMAPPPWVLKTHTINIVCRFALALHVLPKKLGA